MEGGNPLEAIGREYTKTPPCMAAGQEVPIIYTVAACIGLLAIYITVYTLGYNNGLREAAEMSKEIANLWIEVTHASRTLEGLHPGRNQEDKTEEMH